MLASRPLLHDWGGLMAAGVRAALMEAQNQFRSNDMEAELNLTAAVTAVAQVGWGMQATSSA